MQHSHRIKMKRLESGVDAERARRYHSTLVTMVARRSARAFIGPVDLLTRCPPQHPVQLYIINQVPTYLRAAVRPRRI